MNENKNDQNRTSKGPYVSPAMLSIAADEAKEENEKREKEAQKAKEQPPVKKQPYQPLSFVMGDLSDEQSAKKQQPKPPAQPRKPRDLTPEEEALIQKAAQKASKPKSEPNIQVVHGSGQKKKNASKPSKPRSDIKVHSTGTQKASGTKRAVSQNTVSKQETGKKKAVPKKQNKRRNNYTLYYLGFGLLAVVMLLALSLTVLFPVTDISVVSTDDAVTLSDTQIESYIAESGFEKGDNLLRSNTAAAEKRILASDSSIDEVNVHRKLPGTLVIEVDPATVAYVLYSEEENTYYAISEKGRVVESGSKRSVAKDRLLVSGFTVENCVVGDFYDEKAVLESRLEEAKQAFENAKSGSEEAALLEKEKSNAESEIRRYELFVQLYDKLAEYELDDITAVDMKRSSDISFTYQKRITVELGGYTDIDYKLALAKEIILEQLDQDAKGTLNLSTPSLPGFKEE